MTNTPPAHERLVTCQDCASSTETDYAEGSSNVWVTHSSTCPAWPHHPARELAMRLFGGPPAAEDDDEADAEDDDA